VGHREAAGITTTIPRPRAVVGTGTGRKTSNIYAWPEVVSWVREVIGIDPDEGITYLDSHQHAHLNAELADLVDSVGIAGQVERPGWRWPPSTSHTTSGYHI
jgi:hypothetical protein